MEIVPRKKSKNGTAKAKKTGKKTPRKAAEKKKKKGKEAAKKNKRCNSKKTSQNVQSVSSDGVLNSLTNNLDAGPSAGEGELMAKENAPEAVEVFL